MSIYSVTEQTESGGRDFNPDGSWVTSRKGARGRMQVMPGTIRDPGFGVRPAANDSPEELARVGRDYLDAMRSRYGDMEKAWAAYNMGPGNLDKLLATYGDRWRSYAPKETRAYIRKNMGALSSRTGSQDVSDGMDSVFLGSAKTGKDDVSSLTHSALDSVFLGAPAPTRSAPSRFDSSSALDHAFLGTPLPGRGGGSFNPRGIQGERITSTYRSPEHNREVGGVEGSYHTRRDSAGRPLARDSTPPPGMSMREYHARLKAMNPDLDVIYEGDHVHIEPR